MIDADGYPTEEALKRIRTWDSSTDPIGLVEFLQDLWRYDEGFQFDRTTGVLELHTIGWSGNEDIMVALADNIMFYGLYWQESKRGGHYKFIVKKIK